MKSYEMTVGSLEFCWDITNKVAVSSKMQVEKENTIKNTLKMIIQNVGENTLKIKKGDKFEFSFPCGKADSCFTSKEFAEQITCEVTPNWSVTLSSSGDNVSWIVQAKKNYSLNREDTIWVSFNNIVTTYTADFLSFIEIVVDNNETVDLNEQEKIAFLPVYRECAEQYINEFKYFLDGNEQLMPGILDWVCLEWDTNLNLNKVQLYPEFVNDTSADMATQGKTTFQLMEESMTVILRENADLSDLHFFDELEVKSMDEPRITFAISSPYEGGIFKENEKIKLSISVENANYCYVSNGVGRIPVNTKLSNGRYEGTANCITTLTGADYNYEITCIGKEGYVKKNLKVKVG